MLVELHWEGSVRSLRSRLVCFTVQVLFLKQLFGLSVPLNELISYKL